MLRIQDLQVEVDGTIVLRRVDLEIRPGEVHVLFGPNGSGKTSLLMAIMGFPQYRVVRGSIEFGGQDITGLSIHERAQLGLGIAFQRPPTIRGLKIGQLLQLCGARQADVAQLAGRLEFSQFLDRDVNAGLSGGEIKRSELLQLMAQSPELSMIDEPESGVDLENISLVGAAVANLLGLDHRVSRARPMVDERRARHKMGLIITHTGFILDYVPADRGHVLYNGVLGCSGNPREIFQCISQLGYEECVRCAAKTN
ncbi:MAG: ABC transporter ATP-binding protein [Candidatus Bipolaricaulaceae bacterium]